MTSLVLRLPEEGSRHHPNPYLRVKHLKSWLINLPKANTLVAAEQFLQQLETINYSSYPVFERTALLDTLRPVARQFISHLKQVTKNATIPLESRELETYQLIQKILAAMATGYKLVLDELVQLKTHKEHDELQLREAIYVIIQYLSRQLVEAYLVYAPAPANVWYELHSLYLYAEEHALQLLPVDDPYPDFSLPTHYTIDLAYKRILLLALAEPYHMMQGEADDIYYLVSAWTAACHIWPRGTETHDSGYAVDMTSDQPPRLISDDHKWDTSQARTLDIDEVKQRLDIHLQRLLRNSLDIIDHNEQQSLIERRQRDMLLRLSEAWYGDLSRQFIRQPSAAQIRMTSGLNACHFYISGGEDFTPAIDELNLKAEEIEPPLYATAYVAALEKDRYHKNRNYPIRPWWQFNVSEAGTALSCKTDCRKTHVKVGEVVTYLDKLGSSRFWTVGIVRWLKSKEGDGMEMGIMNLANSAVPVAVKALKGPGWGTEYFRGLLIPKQVSLHQTRSILVPAAVYDVNSELAVNLKKRLFYIRLKSLLRATTEFCQFTFEVLEHEPVNEARLFME